MSTNRPPGIDPRWRVVYLGGIAIASLAVRHTGAIAGLACAQVVFWLALRLGVRNLVRQLSKLLGFAAFIVVSYALTKEDPDVDRFVTFHVWRWSIDLNVGGAALGGLMMLRVATVVLASRVARAGDERAIAEGLGRLHVPKIIATTIDTILALFGRNEESEEGRRLEDEGESGDPRGVDRRATGGGGGGGGGGRRRRAMAGSPGAEAPEGFWKAFRRMARGDVGPIVQRVEMQVARAERHLADQGLDETQARDMAVIAGVALAMLGMKALKVLPSIPFAPGHKLVILTPLYVVAALRTQTRFGATITGTAMGFVAFLFGDGRYGVFEVLKHIAPGLVIDLAMPFVGARGARNGPIVWSVLGGLMGASRFLTIFVVTLTVQAPAVAYAFLVPGFCIHTGFGLVSGFVTWQIVRALERGS